MGKKDYKLYLAHILDAIKVLKEIQSDPDYSDIADDPILQSSAAYQLIIIGEAVKSLPEEFLRKAPNVPWASIKAMRNRLVHEYYSIDYEVIIDVIDNHLENLEKAVELLKKTSLK